MEAINSKELFGGEIQYFRTDPEYWEEIIRKFKSAGLRCVTTYVQWSTHLVAPPDAEHPAGVLDFEGKTNPRLNLMKFIALVEKYGLNLNFRCGPFCCNEMIHGALPEWLVMGDPNMMVWDYQNRTTKGYWIGKQEGSQPSYLHPEYLEWCEKWIKEVDKIIVPHLKKNGGCITMVNLDNEVSYIVQDGFLSSDYNPVNVGRGGYYHQFLKQKYHTAENLPYEHKYDCIEDVPAPRAIPESADQNLAWYVDWCEFKTWTMAEYIRRLREMHESNGVTDVLFMTNLNPHLPEGVPTRMPEFEKATGGIVGYDFYRGTFMSYSGYHSMARVLKLMNSSLKYTWSPEFMAGTWVKVLNNRVSDDHMMFMACCALAHGCKSLSWFMFHDRDCWGDSPVSSHGQARPSINVLKTVMELLFEKIHNWDKLVPMCDTAVIYDLIQHEHTCLGDPNPCDDGREYVGAPTISGVKAGLASKEYAGMFRLIEESGYQAAVVDIMHSRDKLAGYPVAFLPGSALVEGGTNEVLKQYIADGGVLVVSGAWPDRDEHGEKLQFLDIQKPVSDEHTAVIGKGKVIWFPEYIAQEKPEEEDLASVSIVKGILDTYVGQAYAKISTVKEVSWIDWKEGGGHTTFVQPRCLGSAIVQQGGDESILFVLNHYPDAVCFNIELKDKACSKLVNLLSGEEIAVCDGKAVVDVDRKQAAIYRME